MIALLLGLTLSPSPAGGSPFDGTWLMDLGSIDHPARTVLSLHHGVFARGEPGSAVPVTADGAFHPVTNEGDVDAVAVTAIGPRVVREVDRFRGRTVYRIVYRVSADGTRLSQEVVDDSKPDRKPIPTTIVYRRTEQRARGASPIDGVWQTITVATTRDHLAETLTLKGNHLSSAGAGGYGFAAEVDGPPVPVRGDADTARVQIEMPSDHVIVEHLSLGGAATVDVTMTLLSDERTIRVSVVRRKDGSRRSWLLHRQ